jgi:CubicO group peptidase (beta-lactamase class C family)
VIGADSVFVPAGITLGNWMAPPYSRWSFQHVEDFLPTAVISRGTGPVAVLPADAEPVAAVQLTRADGRTSSVATVMEDTGTDGWAVAHRGRMVAEQYRHGLTPDTRHLLFSVSKSMVGVVAGALHGDGVLDVEDPVTEYVPALRNSGYAGATVRQLLDMRTGVVFSDDYGDPHAQIHALDQSFGWAPRSGPSVPATLRDFLMTLAEDAPHGGPFEYRSTDTDVLGWICEVAAGQRMPELMSEVLWSRLGAYRDATIGVDSAGTGMFNGGINAVLTDLIRFGSLFLREGVSLTGQQVLPMEWIADTLTGGPDSRAAFADCPADTGMPGGMYRNQMWVPYPGDDVLLCLGMLGQMVYINRPAQVVAAKVSTQEHSPDPHPQLNTLRAFDAVADALGGAAV